MNNNNISFEAMQFSYMLMRENTEILNLKIYECEIALYLHTELFGTDPGLAAENIHYNPTVICHLAGAKRVRSCNYRVASAMVMVYV